MTAGRPTKYREEFCEIIKKELSKGHSVQAASATLGVASETVYQWKKIYPKFSDSIKEGLDLGLQLFEKLLVAKVSGQSVKGFDSKKSDTACLIFALKTRFHKIYGDVSKHEVDIKTVEVNIESQDAGL
jgi:hypothetical protein